MTCFKYDFLPIYCQSISVELQAVKNYLNYFPLKKNIMKKNHNYRKTNRFIFYTAQNLKIVYHNLIILISDYDSREN